ncbi:MAG TPA: MoxR family ATPase [Solirubrobacterales bacterium]
MGVPVTTPSHLDDDFGLSALIEQPLEAPWSSKKSFAKVAASIRDGVAIDDEALRVAMVLLQHWHTMLVGPPGTGKTLLAERAAEIWNVKLIRVTPSMDWTAFHAIGGRAPRAGSLGPYDGEVTKAILDCCRTVVERQATGKGFQATWLLIDEINRCEADRAFGPLLTTLGSRTEPQILDLTHHDDPLKRFVQLPPGFRIIATANLSDAQFVEQMSQAFVRRFQRMDVRTPGPPPESAIESFSATGTPSAIKDPFLHEFAVVRAKVAEERPSAAGIDRMLELLAQLVVLARYARRWEGYGTAPDPLDPAFDTLAIGTAQVVDAMLLAADLEASPAGLAAGDAVDVAAARTIAPQLARLGPESLRAISEQLESLEILSRLRRELADSIRRFESGSYF